MSPTKQMHKEYVQEEAAQSVHDMSTSVHDMSISFGEIDLEDPADVSFVPLSETSTSSHGTGSGSGSGSGAGSGWEGKKWLVDEFQLMELFQTCRTCGTGIEDKRVVTQGSQIKICWTCLNGHTGEWTSCPDTRGMARNNLLICASVLFTGSTYTEIKEWANLLNLQIPSASQFFAMQSKYLIPAVNNAYRDQEVKIMERLRQQSASGNKVELCGDARCDSPGKHNLSLDLDR